jgi:TfoX-like protein
MAYDERLVERVRKILGGRADVVEKRMVGGRSFMVSGHLCCGVAGSDLMVRVGPAAYQSALAQPHTRPMRFAGRPVMGYVLVAPDGYRATTALATWVQRGIDFVSTLPAVGSVAYREREA